MLDTLLWVAGKLVFPLLDPVLLLFAVLWLCGALVLIKRPKLARRLLLVILVGWTLLSVFRPGAWISWQLEQIVTAPAILPDNVDGIIVLGGSVSTILSTAHGRPEVSGNVDRLLAFAELIRRYPGAQAVYTGGAGALTTQDLKEADVARDLFQRLGLPTERILFERESRSTWENAVLSLEQVSPEPSDTWLLITSARHMPRALGAFEAAGWPSLIPFPVDFRFTKQPPEIFAFNPTIGLVGLRSASYEILGLAWYSMTDRWQRFGVQEAE